MLLYFADLYPPSKNLKFPFDFHRLPLKWLSKVRRRITQATETLEQALKQQNSRMRVSPIMGESRPLWASIEMYILFMVQN